MTRVFAVVTYDLPEGTDREAAVQMFREPIPAIWRPTVC